MPNTHTIASLKKLLAAAPPKIQLEIMMHIRMAEAQVNTSVKLSKELEELIKKE